MLIRYPGGKQKLSHQIVEWLRRECVKKNITQYREAFFGAGGIGFELLEKVDTITSARINDKDPAIACLWYSVVNHLEDMTTEIREFEKDLLNLEDITVDPKLSSRLRKSKTAVGWFRSWQDDLRSLSGLPIESKRLAVAMKKLKCHQTSFSGLGTQGGPIGGWEQSSDWGIGCRYSTKTLTRQAIKANKLLSKLDLGTPDVCSCVDFMQILDEPGDCIFYLDPPYYEQGTKLYLKSFTHEDHVRLAERLKTMEQPWLLSYDVNDEIKKLYDGFSVREVPLMYSVTWHDPEEGDPLKAKDRTELVISNFELEDVEEKKSKRAKMAPAA